MMIFSGDMANYLAVLLGTFLVFLLLVLLAAKIFSLFTFTLVQKKWRNRQTIIAEYEPPLKLSPEELGYVFDRVFSDNELASVVVRLIQTGHLTATVKHSDWRLKRTGQTSTAGLSGAELIVLGEFGLHPDSSLSWRQISSAISETIGVQASLEAAITNSLIDRGLVSAEGYGRLTGLKNSTALLLGLVLSVITVWVPLAIINRLTHASGLEPEYQNLDAFLTTLFLLPLFGLSVFLMYWYSKLVVYVYYRGSGLPTGATSKLRRAWPEVIGYREFLKTVEFGRLKTAGRLSDPVLPYCVALGFNMKAIRLEHRPAPKHPAKASPHER